MFKLETSEPKFIEFLNACVSVFMVTNDKGDSVADTEQSCYIRYSYGRTKTTAVRMFDPKTGQNYRTDFICGSTSVAGLRRDVERIIHKCPEKRGVRIFLEALRVSASDVFQAFDAFLELPMADNVDDEPVTDWMAKALAAQAQAPVKVIEFLIGHADKLTDGLVQSMAMVGKQAYDIGKAEGQSIAANAINMQSTIDKAVERGFPTLEKLIFAMMSSPAAPVSADAPPAGIERVRWNREKIHSHVMDLVKTVANDKSALDEKHFADLYQTIGIALTALNQLGTERGWIKDEKK